MDFAEELNANMQFYGGLFTQSVIFVDGLKHRHIQRRFWTHFQQIQKFSDIPTHQYRWNQIFAKFIVFFFVFLVNAYSMVREMPTLFQLQIGSAVIAMRMYHIRIFHYMICSEIVRVNVKCMETRAIEAVILRGAAGRAVAEIRVIHHLTTKMIVCMNDAFGYSQLDTLLFSFFLPLTDLNWAYMRYHNLAPIDKISETFHRFVCG